MQFVVPFVAVGANRIAQCRISNVSSDCGSRIGIEASCMIGSDFEYHHGIEPNYGVLSIAAMSKVGQLCTIRS